ncbi:hypothetical protein BofuT4_uP019810.1 [Botrytis cinerea T4]|uniref:Uncharacterized protein n=1 Tax=Botryotinia fuckeliana (strain T4) TaxID=999810 RepID=G2YIY8_BOTF4|nr:hypothetical protein BofuT4_uP019810.1 [Botrytis cinerea T4]
MKEIQMDPRNSFLETFQKYSSYLHTALLAPLAQFPIQSPSPSPLPKPHAPSTNNSLPPHSHFHTPPPIHSTTNLTQHQSKQVM